MLYQSCKDDFLALTRLIVVNCNSMNRNCTILWAEDDDDDIGLISEAAGEIKVRHLIDFARNGEDALQKLFRSKLTKSLPQLIVLDNNMPIMTGFETLKQILQYEEFKSIPVVFFTTGQVGSELPLIKDHAQVFLKPSTYESFLQTIKQILALCEQPSVRN